MIKLTLIQGDCLEVLKKLRSESVDLVVTDPPYFIEILRRRHTVLTV